MRTPFSPIHLLLLLLFLLWLVFAINLQLMTLTFGKLGLDPQSALLLLMTSLFGSVINLPLFSMPCEQPPQTPLELRPSGLLRPPQMPFTGQTRVAVNVGGCLVPLFFSVYLMRHNPLQPGQVVLAVATVAALSFWLSRPLPGIGIGMPILVGPIAAAFIAITLGGEQRAPLAYIAGTLGVLIGADLLRLKDIRQMGAPLAAIGGAGTFDGIFMTGLVAVLLT
ncbi:MAG: putative rane protein [Proteobacteria bacterium]|nr:putative rane protein [Pseudomonadota bacterium]